MASAVRGIQGEAVKAFRERRGLSLAALGKTLGMSAQGVWRWENGRAQIPSATVPALAAALGVTICDLYGVQEGHDQKEPVTLVLAAPAPEPDSVDQAGLAMPRGTQSMRDFMQLYQSSDEATRNEWDQFVEAMRSEQVGEES